MALDKKAFKRMLTDRTEGAMRGIAEQMIRDFPTVRSVEVHRVDDLIVRLRVKENGEVGPHYFDVRIKETY